jgi:hypothetical protein
VWGIIRHGKLYRLTFSRSLADHILTQLPPGYEIRRFTFQLGRPLQRGETSASGLYALCSARKDITLRIALVREAAELMCDYDSRMIREAWLLPNSTPA